MFKYLERFKSVGVVGATGLVGREFLNILEENSIHIDQLYLFASEKSVGETIEVNGAAYEVQSLKEFDFEKIEACFFSAPAAVVRDYGPIAVRSGCIVIDDSSAFRLLPDVPLVIPEINGQLLQDASKLFVSTPNCVAVPLALSLYPLVREYGIEEVIVSTYQSVSGAGQRAFDALSMQTIQLLNGQEVELDGFAHRFAFNCIPFIGGLEASGESSEESKIKQETLKILGADFPIVVTSVRVPTFCGHGLSVTLKTKKDISEISSVRELLDTTAGLKVIDSPNHSIFPTNQESTGSDPVFVGRIRQTGQRSLSFWAMTDNLRKGAALNAVSILDLMAKSRSLN